jgi:hypothetical protein
MTVAKGGLMTLESSMERLLARALLDESCSSEGDEQGDIGAGSDEQVLSRSFWRPRRAKPLTVSKEPARVIPIRPSSALR